MSSFTGNPPDAASAADDAPALPPSPAGNGKPPADFGTAQRLRSIRSRFRSNSHSQAHDDDEAAAEHGAVRLDNLPDHPLIPRGKAAIVDTDEALGALVELLRRPQPGADGRPEFAYDSEFIGESTYHPRLCLVQIATARGIWLVDPLAGLDLDPFWQLIGDASVRKVVHAGEQDLEPAVRLAGVAPANVVDTQVLAGFCALPYPTSLAKLVEHFCGVKLGKGLTFTQWDQRPLSKKQLAYAADDVRFLPALASALEACLSGNGLTGWAVAECDRRASVDMLADAGEAWERVRGAGGLTGQQLAVLRELAAWRDEVAREADLPARALLKDEVLIDIARRPPAAAAKLGNYRHMPKPVADRYGEAVMAAIARGRASAPLATGPRGVEPTLSEKFTADAAYALLQTVAASRGIDPNLLASRRDTESFTRRASAGKSVEGHPLMQGWRREAAGTLLLDMLTRDGEARLHWSAGRPRLE